MVTFSNTKVAFVLAVLISNSYGVEYWNTYASVVYNGAQSV